MDGSGMLMLDLTGGFALDLRVLRYFLSVAREERITGAAEYLHLSQPPLSRQLMDLEAEFGKPLFIRGSRKIILTELRCCASVQARFWSWWRRPPANLPPWKNPQPETYTLAEAKATPCGSSPQRPSDSGRTIRTFSFTCSAAVPRM